MIMIQRENNPDVNSYVPDVEPGESPGTTDSAGDATDDIERGPQNIPVPPDTERKAPVEEPPGSSGPPVGDVDDSPKRIV
jgi:hypothetical protein